MSKIKGAAIPERFKDRTLDSYVAQTSGQQKALAFAKEYAQNFDQVIKTGRSAIFVGKPGTGKTHLAIGIALSIMQEQRSPVFVTVQRLIRRVKDSWRTKEETESEVIDAFASPDLLILDEVGVQFGSEFEKQLLFDVLNERYEKLKPSILLSNIPSEQLSDYLGERVTDRLRENGGALIGFNWDSYRKNL
jgi:DNA replication protein DnaC